MGEGVPRDHQIATSGPARPGAPVRDAVVAGHLGDLETAARLVGHPDPAVRAAALGALDRTGGLEPGALAAALNDPEPAVRRRACALAGRGFGTGEIGLELVAALVETVSSDGDASVVEAAAWSLGETGPAHGRSAVRALEHAAREHGNPLCREAAVAALGAIGDADALDTVLAALYDKPAVRRRAAIALAAFDDPRVDVALRRCLTDRDWQVRQAAEDLLDRPRA
jgi:HEAT repeat protein